MTRDQAQQDVMRILREKLEAADLDPSGPVLAATRIVGDLGFTSVAIVDFCVAIGKHVNRKLPFQDLVFRDGKFQDFTVGDMAAFIERHTAGG